MINDLVPFRVLLLHVALDGGYQANLRRVRQLEAGALALHPGCTAIRALGRTPEEDPLTGVAPEPERLAALVRRLLQHEQPEVCWLLSPPLAELAAQLAEVQAAGLEVVRLPDDQVELLLWAGEQAELRRGRAAVARAGAWHPRQEAPERGWTPERVVRTWLRGAEGVLGARALPLPPPDGQGNLHARAARQVECGLEVAFAGGVMREAQAERRWPRAKAEGGGEIDVGALVLRAVLGEGRSYQEAGVAAGLRDPKAAWRIEQRSLQCVRDVLDERRARARELEAAQARQGG